MKRYYFLNVLLFLFGNVIAQNYSVGHTTITFNDPTRSGGFGSGGGPGRQIQTEIYYPKDATGNIANGQFPLIVFGHGFAMAWDAYDNIWNDLVAKGYIMAFPRTEGSIIPTPSHSDFSLDLALVEQKVQALNLNSTSLFFQKLSGNNALMGHSMGGGATFLAAATSTSSSLKTVVGLAPAETNPSAISASNAIYLDALILSGSSDNVTPPNSNHIPIYNNLQSNCKTFLSINNGSHCYFANSNFQCDFGEISTGGPGSLSRAQQHDITSDYVTLWLDFKLKGNCNSWQYFEDSLLVSNRVVEQQSCAIAAPIIINVDTTICPQNSYVYGGVTYSQSGSYHDTLLNNYGCDSIYFNLDLYVSFDSLYVVNYTCNPADSGLFTNLYTNSYGCDSFYTAYNIFSSVSVENVYIDACDEFVLLGNLITVDTLISDTIILGSVYGCDSITNYHISINYTDSSHQQTIICEDENYLLPNGLFTNLPGFYSFTYNNITNCDSIFTLELLVDTQNIIITQNDSIFFINNSFVFDSVYWHVSSGSVTFTSLNMDSIQIPFTNISESFTVYADVFNGNCVHDNVSLTITPTAVHSLNNYNLIVYPNPFENILYFNKEVKDIALYNSLGILVLQQNEWINQLDLTIQSSGVYYLIVEGKSYKIVK